MDRMQFIEEWWRMNGGAFINLDEVLPFVVLHKLPSPTDQAPTPMLLGAQSLQAKVIGTHDPAAFRETLAHSWVEYSARIVEEHRRVIDLAEPEIIESQFPEQLTGEGFSYRRGLFPVETTTGHRMLLTYTTPINSH